MSLGPMPRLDQFDFAGKVVLLRLDINSPIDPVTKRIIDDNRLRASLPTIRYLLDHGARLALIAHQGDTLDYQNLIPLTEHAERLSDLLRVTVGYVDDVCGPAAREAIGRLRPGEAVLLGNLRYLTEEVSTFENAVKLAPAQMLDTFLVRGLAPVVDLYVNDAFSAAHRNAPSMVAFQEIKPFAAGLLLTEELDALSRVMADPARPTVYLLGGAKISDAFGMMKQVLAAGTADQILTCGITGEVMLLAQGVDLGQTTARYIADRGLDSFVEPARQYLAQYPDRLVVPSDLAYLQAGERREVTVGPELPDELYLDIGRQTVATYTGIIAAAGTVFSNGPAGAYETAGLELGTEATLRALAQARGFTVIGGGDTVAAATRFGVRDGIDYVSTAGGALINYLSGRDIPLLRAMTRPQPGAMPPR